MGHTLVSVGFCRVYVRYSGTHSTQAQAQYKQKLNSYPQQHTTGISAVAAAAAAAPAAAEVAKRQRQRTNM